MSEHFQFIVIGGGAAGFFAAVTAAANNPKAKVLLLEKSAVPLAKVRVSGGGRCNVTHACFDARQLAQNYPRGHKELIGPFTRFQPRDTIEWFSSRGVQLKVEGDGRMFPVTDSSQTIIDCLIREAGKLKVEVRYRQTIQQIKNLNSHFILTNTTGEEFSCDALLLATGSSPQGHQFAKAFGHTIQEPVPSLFTFNVPSSPLLELSGISVKSATVSIVDSPFKQTGPLLLTHWGFSGPGVLKLSAWAARLLHERNYKTEIEIDWLPEMSYQEVQKLTQNPVEIPKNLWKRLKDQQENLKKCVYKVDGKTTYKEEFVTCGGVTLREINFKTMESRLCPRLYFAGEVLDIDAITGGFNFQNAWTTGWIVGTSLPG